MRQEVAAKIAGFDRLTEDQKQEIIDLCPKLIDQPAIRDVIAERAYQTVRWDEHNSTHIEPSIDSYIGLAVTYMGGASCSYRNNDNDKREMLMKAAAILLQAVNHIDEGRLS